MPSRRLQLKKPSGFWEEAGAGAIVSGACYPLVIFLLMDSLVGRPRASSQLYLIIPCFLQICFIAPVIILISQFSSHVFRVLKIKKLRLYMATLLGACSGFIASLFVVGPVTDQLGYFVGFKFCALATVMCQIGATIRGKEVFTTSKTTRLERDESSVPRFRITHLAVVVIAVGGLLTYLKLSGASMTEVVLFLCAWFAFQLATMVLILGVAGLSSTVLPPPEPGNRTDPVQARCD